MRKHIDWKRAASVLLILVVLLASIAGGAAYAKYVTRQTLGGTVTMKASLGTIELWEHKAVDSDGDGEYTLDATQEVMNNTYVLLPGLDIPKDPYVRITGKTTIAAYVFVEVVDGLGADSGITYALTDDWTELKGVVGAHGGTVYVYKTAVSNTFGDNGDGNGDIQILENNTVYVSQNLDKRVKDLNLKFYAAMYEVASGDDPTEVYKNNT